MDVTYYGYPKCTTCKKAEKWLKENDISYAAANIAEEPPSAGELRQMVETSGLPLKKFFNTSGQKYRELGLKDKLPAMSEDEQLALLASEGMLIKRPLVTDGEKTTVGFAEQTFEDTWKS
ncbi:arsenate reductase family protein [Sporosarcina trichiuri]|uniref:arsenate reductase family protein n=1 Tax=Sporosarcina trichiuri TaxID=3056445 RepID=UPI0025B5BC77|nr:arsenate reductase family protein [Sporosarcina sp. 0.2-SM1T-5]WJY27758.1 arsenate reductase family protein [Sporosarcina sp. 0.2-SM1T-5]